MEHALGERHERYRPGRTYRPYRHHHHRSAGTAGSVGLESVESAGRGNQGTGPEYQWSGIDASNQDVTVLLWRDIPFEETYAAEIGPGLVESEE